jgi:hypothetical protein
MGWMGRQIDGVEPSLSLSFSFGGEPLTILRFQSTCLVYNKEGEKCVHTPFSSHDGPIIPSSIQCDERWFITHVVSC